MRARILLLLGAALALGACQTTYQVEPGRSYAEDKRVVFDHLLAFLERNEIALTNSDFEQGSIAAERRHFQDQGWADCERRRVYEASGGSGSPRQSWALRVDRDLVLEAMVTAAASATRVTVDATFTEKQDDPNSFNFFTQPCRSKSTLEAALFDALGTAVATSSLHDTTTE
jgi:hypothetical protein